VCRSSPSLLRPNFPERWTLHRTEDREGDNLYRVGPYCFTNRIKITAMQQTLRGEGDREIYTYKKEGGPGIRKGINELETGGGHDERKRDKTGKGESVADRERKRWRNIC
jgi:hypothetical protein